MTPGEFWVSPMGRMIQDMKATGNGEGVVARYKLTMENYVTLAPKTPEAQALKAWLPHFQVRPFYTARELAPLLPALCFLYGHTKTIQPQIGTERLRNLLVFGELPRLQNALGEYTFNHPSYPKALHDDEFFIVERIHYWKERKLFQGDLRDAFTQYG